MGLKERVARLEQALQASTERLIMQDGRPVQVLGDDLLDCLLAAMHGEEHPLLVTVRGARRDAGNDKIVRLIHAFDTVGHRQFMAEAGGQAGHAV